MWWMQLLTRFEEKNLGWETWSLKLPHLRAAYGLLLYQVAANEWISDILGNFGVASVLWEREAKNEQKIHSGVCPMLPRADGAIWHMVSYSSKMLLSEISLKLEPLRLSLETCPISTSVGSLGCQQKILSKDMTALFKTFFETKRQVCIAALDWSITELPE